MTQLFQNSGIVRAKRENKRDIICLGLNISITQLKIFKILVNENS